MRNKFNFCLLLLILFFIISDVWAQKSKKTSLWKSLNTATNVDTVSDDYYGSNSIRYEDYVYKKNIKTVQLRDESFELTKAILNLGSVEKLKLSFDDLAEALVYDYFLECSICSFLANCLIFFA